MFAISKNNGYKLVCENTYFISVDKKKVTKPKSRTRNILVNQNLRYSKSDYNVCLQKLKDLMKLRRYERKKLVDKVS